ncbi:MAG: RnfABCDGE type electron transport complex subunit D [Woeseiaceae bacterium]|nr:RnfABCDGE type electron transport complex subunit D [Woeseiaceae bacterium]
MRFFYRDGSAWRRPAGNGGRLVYGFGIGFLIYAIRRWGSYADGVAFAVVLMNMAVPAIDYITKPRIVGHPGKRRGKTA